MTKQSLCPGKDCFAEFILSVVEGLAMTSTARPGNRDVIKFPILTMRRAIIRFHFPFLEQPFAVDLFHFVFISTRDDQFHLTCFCMCREQIAFTSRMVPFDVEENIHHTMAWLSGTSPRAVLFRKLFEHRLALPAPQNRTIKHAIFGEGPDPLVVASRINVQTIARH